MKIEDLPRPAHYRRQMTANGGYEMVPAYTAEEVLGIVAAQWQPIETAPKDGTHILAVLPDRDGCCYVICWADVDHNIRRYLGSPNVGWHMAYDGDFLQPHDGPTHWMPLPKAP